MASIIIDSGALIAIERGNQQIAGWIKEASSRTQPALLPTAVVAETWRGGQRSALIARAMAGCPLIPLDEELAKQAGLLLGQHATFVQQRQKSLVVDAIVVMTAVHSGGGRILTSDPGDIGTLADGYQQVQVEAIT